MKILNIKDKDLSIIIPYKNGHTLLYTTFIHLFKHLNIEFEMEGDVSKFLGNSYIFVRNPIDRFFSSYFFMEFVSKLGTGIFSKRVKHLVNSSKIYNINGFIKDYDNLIMNQDFIYKLTEDKFSKNYFRHIIEEIKNN